VAGAFEPILASGGTVIAGVLILLFSDLNSNKALGPVAAAGIAVAMLAALTFLPALLALLGRAAFFPFPPRVASTPLRASPVVYTGGLWARVADLVARRPRRVWVATTIVLAVAAAFAPAFRADGVPQTAVVLGATESVAGQEVQGRYFAAGSGAPTIVIGAADRADALLAAARAVDGVASAPCGPRPSAGRRRAGPAVASRSTARSLVELQVTLALAPDGDEAIDVVRDLREVVRAVDPGASSAARPPPTSTPAHGPRRPVGDHPARARRDHAHADDAPPLGAGAAAPDGHHGPLLLLDPRACRRSCSTTCSASLGPTRSCRSSRSSSSSRWASTTTSSSRAASARRRSRAARGRPCSSVCG
jgi:hypothetical protein